MHSHLPEVLKSLSALRDRVVDVDSDVIRIDEVLPQRVLDCIDGWRRPSELSAVEETTSIKRLGVHMIILF